jgi:hypothetical protein
MVEVQTWTPLENNTMSQHFFPPPSNVVSPINKSLLASPQLEFGKTIVNEFFFKEKNQITLYKDL